MYVSKSFWSMKRLDESKLSLIATSGNKYDQDNPTRNEPHELFLQTPEIIANIQRFIQCRFILYPSVVEYILRLSVGARTHLGVPAQPAKQTMACDFSIHLPRYPDHFTARNVIFPDRVYNLVA